MPRTLTEELPELAPAAPPGRPSEALATASPDSVGQLASQTTKREPGSRNEAGDGRRRLRRWGGLALLALVLESFLPTTWQPTTHLSLAAIDLYQATLSEHMPAAGVHCRFQPTCSHYGEAVIERYGSLRGGALAVWRIARCGPWTPAGTIDPPPVRAPSPRAAPAAETSLTPPVPLSEASTP
jgi:putative membrane protein insertion efficiency factor